MADERDGAARRRRGDADRLALLPGRARGAAGAAGAGRASSPTGCWPPTPTSTTCSGGCAFPALALGRGGADGRAAARRAGRGPARAARLRRRALREPAGAAGARAGARRCRCPGSVELGDAGARAAPRRGPHRATASRSSPARTALLVVRRLPVGRGDPMDSTARSPTTARRWPGWRRWWRRRRRWCPATARRTTARRRCGSSTRTWTTWTRWRRATARCPRPRHEGPARHPRGERGARLGAGGREGVLPGAKALRRGRPCRPRRGAGWRPPGPVSTWLAPPRMWTRPSHSTLSPRSRISCSSNSHRSQVSQRLVEGARHRLLAVVHGLLDRGRGGRHPLDVVRQLVRAELEVVPVPRLDALADDLELSPGTFPCGVSR